MRQTAIAVFALFGAVAASQAATSVAGANFTGNPVVGFTGTPITDNTGSPVFFSYQAGTFGTLPEFGAPSLDLSGWQSFSSSATGFGTGNAGVPGLFASPYTIADADLQNLNSLAFVVIGNNTDFAASTEYIVLSLGISAVDQIAGAGSLGFSLVDNTSSNHAGDTGTVTVLRGYNTTVQGYTTTPADFTSLNGQDGITFGLIPEPSVGLLGGLAGLLLVVRRKR